MVKIAIDAGHGINTAGKRTPDGEREWSFNNKVLLSCAAKLNKYQGVQILGLDDPTGNTDVSVAIRTNRANTWGADALVSIHHNAFDGKWGSHGVLRHLSKRLPQVTFRKISRHLFNIVL